MIQQIFLIIISTAFVVSCATSPENNGEVKGDSPQNIDSEITFEGVSNPDGDPFFDDPGAEAQDNWNQADIQNTPEEPKGDMANIPEPTPEPQEEMPDSSFSQATAEEPEQDMTPEPMKPQKTISKSKKIAKKKPASVMSGNAMRTPAKDCLLRAKPSTSGGKLGMAKGGRKIWTENHSSDWFKVYRKQGHAFISKTCF
ncbi:MAG: hypothetical protein KDD34_05915 [Bdellovibrionales bacterium]|nr:hypothetical protein [Bdellovibrionales bacterium]